MLIRGCRMSLEQCPQRRLAQLYPVNRTKQRWIPVPKQREHMFFNIYHLHKPKSRCPLYPPGTGLKITHTTQKPPSRAFYRQVQLVISHQSRPRLHQSTPGIVQYLQWITFTWPSYFHLRQGSALPDNGRLVGMRLSYTEQFD